MASISKRQQARNERELQELIRTVPGNNRCADCGANNPGWASWTLGIFLCMRCASIHRKLGTHISRVKSLSMDTWSTDQVENIKRNGNVAVNKAYNPKNKKPDIPIDADEVDSAMERFIRKKYQEKSLLDGKPQPPSHNDAQPGLQISPENSPPPPLPPKKGKFFGFGLRASSSAHPLSKHDKKHLPREPRVDGAFRISSENYGLPEKRSGPSEDEIQQKLATLRDMGFRDEQRNATLLRGLNGNLERTIESLVKIQQVTQSQPDNVTSTATSAGVDKPIESAPPRTTAISNNPFNNTSTASGFGLSLGDTSQRVQTNLQALSPNSADFGTNPFGAPPRSQTDQGLQQAFQNLQVSQPLFPHSTGGYPSQPPPVQSRFQHSMTPPVPSISQQYGYTASSPATSTTNNPFFYPPQGLPAAFSHQPTQSPLPPSASTNPFLNNTGQLSNATTSPANPNFNPFGLPPSASNSPQKQLSTPQVIYDQNQLASVSFSSSQAQAYQFQSQMQQQHPFFDFNPQYGQPQSQMQPQQSLYAGYNPQSLQPQRTGRIDKSSILALYNYPHLAPQPLAPIPEPGSIDQQQQIPQHVSSPPPSFHPQRSVTMPLPSSPSATTFAPSASQMNVIGGSGPTGSASAASRNPFLNMSASSNQSSSPLPQQQQSRPVQGMTSRHISADSVNINNAALESGRHSPDAFASLSARFVR